MAFFQELHDVGSGHHEEDTFTIQKLLYPTDSSKGDRTGSLPSHSSLQAADSFSKPALLKDLYDDITMVLFIFGTMRQEDRPNCMTIITCDNAKEIEKLLYGHKIDLWVIDSLLKSTGNGELYAELFRAVAEIIFLYCTKSPFLFSTSLRVPCFPLPPASCESVLAGLQTRG